MFRTTTLVLALALPVVGCARQLDGTATTNVTSAPVVTRDTDDASTRLADEICARENACGHVADGGRYRTIEACMADQGAQTPGQLARWSCAPTKTQPGFEQCLAAIRGERCETALPRVDRLIACRSVSVCGR
jgi:hypothetical protein